MEKVQNLFIGYGKGAKTLAATLASKGEEVVLVEESDQMYGGACINVERINFHNKITRRIRRVLFIFRHKK